MKRRWILFFSILVIGTLFLTRSYWLPLPAAWLTVNDSLERTDVIFLPSGHTLWRAAKAAELFREGYAPKILVTGGYYSDYFLLLMGERVTDAEVTARLLVRSGVPQEAVVLLNGVTSTYEEAVFFRDYVRAYPVKSAILVTSHLHSRRAKWVFQKVLNNHTLKLVVVEAEQPNFTVHNWWQQEDGLITVLNEYIKLAYYFLHY